MHPDAPKTHTKYISNRKPGKRLHFNAPAKALHTVAEGLDGAGSGHGERQTSEGIRPDPILPGGAKALTAAAASRLKGCSSKHGRTIKRQQEGKGWGRSAKQGGFPPYSH